ncbi:NADPH:quinone oxidoreductase [Knoellia sinensis KCTC 19936]|uniref:NADPH:quinone oxidoreductase n=1 Tax=Knoellia sinensis KCTC 19936 TaxID=1385520 RepID=A0A0A0J4J4_9MICO|nr:NAD(P)-dependent alcohol dehydrogenase [Knoellia sinensis]KGN32123.1 NADPH:quinone oxidoreductase [Knoellia sinensis KCTC 19936]
MRAAVNTRYGPPEVVRLEEVEPPVPGPGDVLVRVRATTVNRTDCAYRAAHPFFMRTMTGLSAPKRTILGTEYAGEVTGVGSSVTTFAVGERVFGYCEGTFGAHAEQLVAAAASMIAKTPEGVTDISAAAATEGSHYARSAITRGGVRAGQRVLVNGATGGIGSAAVQLLRALGAEVTAVCAGEHFDLVRGLGATDVVDYSIEDFTRLDERFDVVIDAVGKSTFRQCRHLLEPGGVYISSELGPGWQNLPLALIGTATRGRRRVVFPYPEEGQHVVEEIRDHLAVGTFRPVVERTYPLEDIVDAYRYVESGEKIGNVVITVDQD